MSSAQHAIPHAAPWRNTVAVWVLAGFLGGFAAGWVDCLWSWSPSSQFLHGFVAKLRFGMYTACSYAFIASIIAPVVATICRYFSDFTALGGWLRSRNTDDTSRLALVVTMVPTSVIFLYASYSVAYPVLQLRKRMDLVVIAAMAVAVVACIASILVTLALSPWLDRALVRLSKKQWLTGLRRPHAPLVALIILVAGACSIAAFAWSDTLSALRLRGPIVVGIIALFTIGVQPAARNLFMWLGQRPRYYRWSVRALVPVATIAILLSTGDATSVQKAVSRYTGIGGALTLAYQRLADFDRDGHAGILGGGDCDGWDGEVYPGAVDIPDDGIDQNCTGDDLTLAARTIDEIGFTPPPDGIVDYNHILITIDTVRADHVGAYGYRRPTTPNIDALANDGAVFVNAWAHAPSTRYSVPAILTGRYPLQVEYFPVKRRPPWPGIADSNTTIAEVMKSNGRRTGAVTNYWYFDEIRRINQGFDFYDNKNKRLHAGADPATTKGSSSRQQTDKALQFIARNADKKFFLWVHYYDPHAAFQAHKEVQSFGTAPQDLYDNEILFTDKHIGRLFDDLRKRGLYDKTVVTITGDHGEGFGEHGIDFHGYDLYAAQTRIPLIIRVPGWGSHRVTTPVAHVDLLPTLTNLIGGQPTPQMAGRSLVSMIKNGSDVDRIVFQQLSYENNNEKRGAASKSCHVLYNVSPQTSWELYRLDDDPAETRDRIDTPGDCARVRAALGSWYDRSEVPAGAAQALRLSRPPGANQDIRLGDSIRLIQTRVTPASVRRGGTLELALAFEVIGNRAQNWRVFAHFRRKGTKQHFKGDHWPARPTTWWRRGQYIQYKHTVHIPGRQAPGSYELWLGLYNPKTNRRVHIPPGKGLSIDNDSVRVATFTLR